MFAEASGSNKFRFASFRDSLLWIESKDAIEWQPKMLILTEALLCR